MRETGSCKTAEFGGFGASVSTSNGLLAVGAPLAKDGGSIRGGKIFFYQYDPTQVTNGTGGWVGDINFGFPQNTDGTNVTPDSQAGAAYGTVVSIRFNPALNRGILLGGAPLYDVGENAYAGKVYVYEYTAGATPGTGTVQFINSVEVTQADAHFGQSVTSNGIHFLVGAPLTDLAGTDNGAGFLYSFVPVLGGAITQLQALIPTTGTDQNTGISVSLSPGSAPGDLTGSVMLLGGNALASQHIYNGLTSPNGPYSTAPGGQVNTLNGDVFQDGDIAGFGFQGDRVELFFDKQNVSGMPDWLFQKTESEYGRDISVAGGSGLRVMVNGNGNTTIGDGGGVAYAYYTASCYHGGDLKANEWTMIGLQCDVSSAGAGGAAAATIDEIFTPDLGAYDTNWVMYQQTTKGDGKK
ncbi:hypothetical protein [Methyloprofundus sp.]|uniref:hypothetical protein n=1 Tax=Methyloprofundus sp. TaxID=2020875 RepID=UPI003D0C69D7